MRSEQGKANKYQYDLQYAHNNLKQFRLALNKNKDTEIIAKLNSVPNKTEYIKNLILKDIGTTEIK